MPALPAGAEGLASAEQLLLQAVPWGSAAASARGASRAEPPAAKATAVLCAELQAPRGHQGCERMGGMREGEEGCEKDEAFLFLHPKSLCECAALKQAVEGNQW